ncbi:hypothetical protein EON63_01140 [archaeon]|nr:MAG: hypothetical protein EON63_01140 [archaeon]
MIIKMQSTIRRFLAVRRVARYKVPYPMVARVSVIGAEGVATGGDVCAIISGLVLAYAIDHPALVNPAYNVTHEMIKTAGKVTSNYRVEHVLGGGRKVAQATALNKLDFVIVTLFDKAQGNELIGQVSWGMVWIWVWIVLGRKLDAI